jgi:hypothetical protein
MVPMLLATTLLGCNRYDLFRIAGYQQESFNNKADVLFVLDNSPTMAAYSMDMAVNFAGFITELDTFEQNLSYEGLPDAVTNYVDAVQNRSAYVDYQFAMVTTDVPTDAGQILGPVLARGDENVPERFIENLACEGTCFDGTLAVPTDPGYQCGDPLGDILSEEFLDCTCGGSYTGNCGTADEEGIEAVFLAMCRAVESPPEACFEDLAVGEEPDLQEYPALLDRSDIGSNPGLLRDGSNLVVVVVSDEGDGSRRQWDQADDSEKEIPDEYTALFEQFRHRMTWVYVGQDFDEQGHVRCPSAGSDWGAVRYHYLAYTTGGRFIPLFDESCDPIPFEQTLTEIGELLTNLLTEFPLQSVPVPGTLVVLVDGKQIDEATITGQDQFGLDLWSDGWSYRNADNTVLFHGAAVPGYDANVEVYYKPVDGMPRELPF